MGTVPLHGNSQATREVPAAEARGMRVACHQSASHAWFEGANIHTLYQSSAVELGAGKVKKGDVDEQWTRRQHSSIWSPQPEKYSFGSGGASGGREISGELNFAAILDTPIVEESDAGVAEESKEERRRMMLPPSSRKAEKEDLRGIAED